MTDPKHDHDDYDHEPDLPGEGGSVAPAPAAGALTSLATLSTALNSVDTATIAGRSGLAMLQFKREGSGTWLYGQKRTIVEEGSTWGVNPLSFKRGYICFNESNKPIGERLVPINQPMPDEAELPDKGFKWSQQWAVNLKCVSGADAGTEVVYKPTTVGGIQAVVSLIEAVRDRLNGGGHDGKVSPIVRLAKDSYQHGQFGRVWYPVLEIVSWMPLSGPAPAPDPEPAPTTSKPAAASEPPRRRRVAA